MSRLAPLALFLAAASVLLVPGPASAKDPKPNTPIEHVIYLMQENHSFDNYFGTYPGADGIPAGTCMPVDPSKPKGKCVKPFHIGGRPVEDLAHSETIFDGQYNGGKMDGFVHAHRSTGAAELAMGYYDDRDLPYYWNIADRYVLFDRFFSSARGGSLWNHMFWISATPGAEKDEIPEDGFKDVTTVFDRLEEAGISWKFYVQNYDPTITFRNREGLADRGSQVIWAPVLAFPRFLDNPRLFGKIVDLDEYYSDLQQGTLPAVAFMVPSGASEHPPGSIQAGERFVRTLINALMRSDVWSSSAFVWTYDDWGGWYDHVPPPQVDEHGYGFRVPALLVSPYAHEGRVDSTQLDYTSVLRFIEDNWDLEPLARRDRQANSIVGAFDFERPPREPVFLSAERATGHEADPDRAVLYAAYAAALGLAGLVVAGAASGHRVWSRFAWVARRQPDSLVETSAPPATSDDEERASLLNGDPGARRETVDRPDHRLAGGGP